MKPDAEWLLIQIRAIEKRLNGLASTGGLRTPAHNTTHQSGGSDAIKLDDLAAPDDNTDLDASATKHGLMPKWTAALISALLDLISSTRGVVLYRGASAWAALAPGTATNVLTANGAGADPSWEAASGGSGITELTGDVTAGPGSGSQAATLAATGVSAATYGDATHVAQVAVDAKGRITSASNVSITYPSGATATRYAVIGFTFDGAGLPLTAGMKGYVRYMHGSGTIVNISVLSADEAATAGDAVIDIWKEASFAAYPPTDADSITGATPPTLTAVNHLDVTTFAGFSTVAVTRGDSFGFNVDSCSGITKLTVEVSIELT